MQEKTHLNLSVFDHFLSLALKGLLKYIWSRAFFKKKLGFTPCKTEQSLQGMELQEKETQND